MSSVRFAVAANFPGLTQRLPYLAGISLGGWRILDTPEPGVYQVTAA